MAVDLKWSPQARSDLLKIYVDIGIEQPVAAERYYIRIESKAQLLSEQPRMGIRRRDIKLFIRMLVEAPFVIFYRTVPDPDEAPIESVEVLRVVDGRQDLPNLF
jgi:toxin ParE1/3/4